jgi:hypothetical protein
MARHHLVFIAPINCRNLPSGVNKYTGSNEVINMYRLIRRLLYDASLAFKRLHDQVKPLLAN